MKKIIFIITLFLLISLANAQEVKVIKEVKTSITQDENLDVKIIFNNPYPITTKFQIKEILPQGVTLVNPSRADNFEYHDGILASIYKWQITLDQGELASITYTIKPNGLGEYGISPTKLTDPSNKVYLSNPVQFNVYCQSNNICEKNENSLNCPLDCDKGIKDNICDYRLDNICDEDCENDPDCGFFDKNSASVIFAIALLIIIIFFIYTMKKRY